MREKRPWAVSVLAGAILVTVVAFQNDEAQERDTAFAYDKQAEKWTVSGTYRFTRLSVRVFGHTFPALERTGEFCIQIPDGDREGASSEQYGPEARVAAQRSAGKWRLHLVPLFTAFAVCALIVRFFLWLGEQYRQPLAAQGVRER